MTPLNQSYREIPLTRGQVALVDTADFDWLNQWKWCAVWRKEMQSYYAARSIRLNGKKMQIYMHRLILGLEFGNKMQGDHIRSGQTLDNRRSNIRVATKTQNNCNSRPRIDNKCGLKGVHWETCRNRWVAEIRILGKRFHLGCFLTKEAAFAAYCEAATRHHGEFARLA